MTLFRLDASISPATSASRELGDLVEAEWLAAHPGDTVVRRDLAADPVPAHIWPLAVSTQFLRLEDLDPAQREAADLARTLADELLNADALLLDVPLYNFGVSQHVKTWFDVVYTTPELGPQGSGLAGKPAVLNTVLGGNYGPGTPREGWDHSTGWLRRVMEDVWKLDLTVIQRSFTLVGVNPALDSFADMAADLKVEAEAAAIEAGQRLAERISEPSAV
ncbi:FMN-dependent NADH-azoreductase [Naasia lichenicola]|uniref:Flavodoxin family protein n=1 Tax=Naasia lichenicola TaxID=2565933 RepID=A0A4S4FJ37_9MICO|nr:NAD(P)H-dependent oxidoreductase [Naasia lichenicola]THG29904.1 flavodoxin family protein [Naasia lichenicola]